MAQTPVEITAERPTLIGPDELARYLDVPLTTIYQWNHRGGGPPFARIGRHVRYLPADVDAWLESKKAA